VTWTLMITVMSSTLYQLSYSLLRGWWICTIVPWAWVKYVYYYINPLCFLD
jgi:hypothetical protein